VAVSRHEGPNRRLALSENYEPRVTLLRVWTAFLALGAIIILGVLGYMLFEGWSFMDALYMTIITVTTVGYREVHELDTTGRLWTMALLITGVGTLFYAAVSSVELAVEGAVGGYFERRRMKAELSKLNGHYILCGFGRVGRQVAREFALDGVPFVVVDNDPQVVEYCLAEGYLAMLGEASNDAALEEAGIQRAKGLVAAVSSDAENVFVTLSARKMNPSLQIVARASSDESAAKLEIAGADRTLSPYTVGGRRLASLATQPLIVDFLDIVTRGRKDIEFRLEEFNVPAQSPLANHTIGELKIGDKTGAMILAILSKEGKFDTTPSATDTIRPGDTLIVLGTREQIRHLETLLTEESR
jgi:voltage-gated potassium channel